MARKQPEPPQVVPKEFTSADEIQRAIAKLERRIKELEMFDSAAAVLHKTGADEIIASNVRETIRALFGTNSPEFQEHQLTTTRVELRSFSTPLIRFAEHNFLI
jgi:hypothetical protein